VLLTFLLAAPALITGELTRIPLTKRDDEEFILAVRKNLLAKAMAKDQTLLDHSGIALLTGAEGDEKENDIIIKDYQNAQYFGEINVGTPHQVRSFYLFIPPFLPSSLLTFLSLFSSFFLFFFSSFFLSRTSRTRVELRSHLRHRQR
jgi:hypothetical protein